MRMLDDSDSGELIDLEGIAYYENFVTLQMYFDHLGIGNQSGRQTESGF